jgi:hypothetical protein
VWGGRGNDRIELGTGATKDGRWDLNWARGSYGHDVIIGGDDPDGNKADGGTGTDGCVDPGPDESGAVSCEQRLTEPDQHENSRRG